MKFPFVIAMTLSLVAPLHVAAEEEEPPPSLCPNATPDPGTYYVLFAFEKRCQIKADFETPSPASVFCTQSSGAFSCEAWPKGHVTFSWSASPSLTLDYPGNKSGAQTGVCSSPNATSGSVYVTITSKFGLQSFSQHVIQCAGGQEY